MCEGLHVCVCTQSQVTSFERVVMRLSPTGAKVWTVRATEHAQWPFDWQPAAVVVCLCGGWGWRLSEK